MKYILEAPADVMLYLESKRTFEPRTSPEDLKKGICGRTKLKGRELIWKINNNLKEEA